MPHKNLNAANEGFPPPIEKQKEENFCLLGESLVNAMDKEIKYVLWGSAALALAALCFILM